MPIKDHIGILEIEKPNSDEPNSNTDCSITSPADGDPWPFLWSWRYTYAFDESGEIAIKNTPWDKNLTYNTGGCCNGTFSYPVGSGDCSHYLINPVTNLIDTTMVNPKWRLLHVSQIYRFWENVNFFDDGTFYELGASYQTNVSLLNSDFCNKKVSYYQETHSFPNYGTHDFMPGSDYLNITYDPSTVPRKTLRSGEIIYSCNTLNLTFSIQGDGETLTYIMFFLKFRYTEDGFDGPDYEPPWEIITENPYDHAI